MFLDIPVSNNSHHDAMLKFPGQKKKIQYKMSFRSTVTSGQRSLQVNGHFRSMVTS